MYLYETKNFFLLIFLMQRYAQMATCQKTISEMPILFS